MKINIKNKIILMFLICLIMPASSIATEDLIKPEYTEEYLEWLQLSDEEKQEYIQPEPFKDITKADEQENITLFSNSINAKASNVSVLPTSYRNSYYGSVKYQGLTDACWAYSSATMFDTNYYLVNNNKKIFSSLHMDYITSRQYNSNGFSRNVASGGNVYIAMAYATNGMGIALDKDFSVSSNLTSAQVLNTAKTAKVSDYIEILGTSEIKNYIYKYGTPVVYTYIGNDYKYFSSSQVYGNKDLAYFCPNSKQAKNHAVALIGWDDNYTNSSFPGKTGAYIALNSYGSNFGDNGIYYIFYADALSTTTKTLGATKTIDNNYDYLYQYDEYGPTAECGYENGTYLANVFSKKDADYTENLTEISSYFPQAGEIIIYINCAGDDVRISSATHKLTTTISEPGYHTIKLSTPLTLSNSKFVVGIKYPGIVAAEIPTEGGWCSTVTSNSGESFISYDGINYTDMKVAYQEYTYANACIKAFTKKGEKIAIQSDNNSSNIEAEYTDDLENYMFDYKYYAEHNPDIFIAFGYNEAALRNHWNTYGKLEGRASSSIFNVKYYGENNPDLKTAFGNNYVALYNHFINYGFAEYRKSSLEYDGNYYRNNNIDLKNMSSMQLIRHYMTYGKGELRRASSTYDITEYLFDAAIYKALNPDVALVYGNNAELLRKHWYQYGISEGRVASLIFDARYYLQDNKDVVNAFSNTNYMAAYNHFINYGFNEGRRGTQIFSSKYYLAKNSDLKNAYGDNLIKVVNHFVNYGKYEPRVTSEVFNVNMYMKLNADLRNSFKTNYEKYFIHYLTYGKNEKRICI